MQTLRMDLLPEKRKGFEPLKAGLSNRKEISNIISDFKLFEDLTGEQIVELSWHVHGYQLAEGVTVFEEGEPGSFLCLIAEGQVEIVGHGQDGTPHRLVLMGKGKTVGEMSIIDHELRSASCITTQPTTLLILTEESYTEIVRKHPPLALAIVTKLAKHMSQRLRGVSGQLVDSLAH